MKKFLALVFIPVLVAVAATEYDFVPGIDLTGKERVSGAQMNQLISVATLANNRGLVIVSNGPPNIVSNPQQTNYIWVDVSVPLQPSLKFYVGGVGWTNALSGSVLTSNNIADGSIVNSKLGPGAVSQDKILPYAVGNLQIADSAISEVKLAASSVTSGKLAADSVTTISITNLAVTGDKIADGTITSGKILTINANSITNFPALVTNIYPNAYITGFLAGASSGDMVLVSVSSNVATFEPHFFSATNDLTGSYIAPSNQVILFTAAHELGYTPSFVRLVFVFTNSVWGFGLGEEIDTYSITASNAIGEFNMASIGASTTNVYATVSTNLYYGGDHYLNVRSLGQKANAFGRNFSTNLYGTWKFYYR